jgi:hypothetical protein
MPCDLHRELKARAARAGMSLSDYRLSELRQVAARPTVEGLRARLARLPPVNPSISAAELIRAERDRR